MHDLTEPASQLQTMRWVQFECVSSLFVRFMVKVGLPCLQGTTKVLGVIQACEWATV